MRSRNVEEIRADGYGTEEDFARRRTARWLLGVMEQNAAVDAGFLRCLCWALGGLDGILKDGKGRKAEACARCGDDPARAARRA